MTTQNIWDAAKAVYSNTILLLETRKASNRQPNPTSKAVGKRTTTTKKKTPKSAEGKKS